MKKTMEWVIFAAIIIVLPGGALLAIKKLVRSVRPKFLAGFFAFGLLFIGCARLQYQDPAGNVRIHGFTMNPEAAMVMSADAEVRRAEAYATRKCSDDSRHCGAVWGQWGAGMMDTPAGYTWAGVRAVGAGGSASENGDIRKDIADIKKSVRAVSKWQDTFTTTLKNKKKGN